MLRISKLASYATVIMTYLAGKPKELLSAKDLAKNIKLPLATVSKILKKLLEAGLVKSTQGVSGGYQLTRSAKAISLAEIIGAIDGKPALTACCAADYLCAQHLLCTTKNNWQIINRALVNILSGITLSDMTKPLHRHPLLKLTTRNRKVYKTPPNLPLSGEELNRSAPLIRGRI